MNLGKTTLIEDGVGYWEPFTPYSIRDGVMLLEDQSPDVTSDETGMTLDIDRSTFEVTVHRLGQPDIPGLISGVYLEDQSHFPRSVSFVSHDDEGGSEDLNHNGTLFDAGLSKDVPGRLWFEQARELAVAQTTQEFIRLVSLIENKYGTAAPVLAAWVKRDDVSRALLQQFFAGHTSPPQIPGELAVDFDRHNSRLDVSWNRADDPDSVDSRIA